MITVTIAINDRVIHARSAVRIAGGVDKNDMNTYKLDDGSIITHRYGSGAVELAQRMLDTIDDDWRKTDVHGYRQGN